MNDTILIVVVILAVALVLGFLFDIPVLSRISGWVAGAIAILVGLLWLFRPSTDPDDEPPGSGLQMPSDAREEADENAQKTDHAIRDMRHRADDVPTPDGLSPERVRELDAFIGDEDSDGG